MSLENRKGVRNFDLCCVLRKGSRSLFRKPSHLCIVIRGFAVRKKRDSICLVLEKPAHFQHIKTGSYRIIGGIAQSFSVATRPKERGALLISTSDEWSWSARESVG